VAAGESAQRYSADVALGDVELHDLAVAVVHERPYQVAGGGQPLVDQEPRYCPGGCRATATCSYLGRAAWCCHDIAGLLDRRSMAGDGWASLRTTLQRREGVASRPRPNIRGYPKGMPSKPQTAPRARPGRARLKYTPPRPTGGVVCVARCPLGGGGLRAGRGRAVERERLAYLPRPPHQAFEPHGLDRAGGCRVGAVSG
jgi:hypothetical protein